MPLIDPSRVSSASIQRRLWAGRPGFNSQ